MSDQNTVVSGDKPTPIVQRSVRGRHYRKFAHAIESVARTHRRQRRNLRVLLRTRVDKAMEQQ